MNSLFVQLDDQLVNLAHIRLVRVQQLPEGSKQLPVLTIDHGLPTGSWTWTPKTKAELDWFYQVISLIRPGQLPPQIEPMKAKLCAGSTVQTPARAAARR